MKITDDNSNTEFFKALNESKTGTWCIIDRYNNVHEISKLGFYYYSLFQLAKVNIEYPFESINGMTIYPN